MSHHPWRYRKSKQGQKHWFQIVNSLSKECRVFTDEETSFLRTYGLMGGEGGPFNFKKSIKPPNYRS